MKKLLCLLCVLATIMSSSWASENQITLVKMDTETEIEKVYPTIGIVIDNEMEVDYFFNRNENIRVHFSCTSKGINIFSVPRLKLALIDNADYRELMYSDSTDYFYDFKSSQECINFIRTSKNTIKTSPFQIELNISTNSFKFK